MPPSQTIFAGNLNNPTKAIIMIHGRGAGAEDILGLHPLFNLQNFIVAAPQAPNFSWYPHSFLASANRNEPALTHAITQIDDVVKDITSRGIAKKNIWLLGFSQGACLTLEYAARHAGRWGGLVAFTGGLIGDQLYIDRYKGHFEETPVFIGTSDPDIHVPVERVLASVTLLQEMGAKVNLKIYKNMGHTISQAEIDEARRAVFNEGVS